MRKKKKNFYMLLLIFSLIFVISIIAVIKFIGLTNNDVQNKNREVLDSLGKLSVNKLVHKVLYSLRYDKEFQSNPRLREQLKQLLNKKFKNCVESEYYNFNYDFIYLNNCSVSYIYHYIDAKILLNNLSDNEKSKIISTINKSYKKDRNLFVKDYLSIHDNILWHALFAMDELNILDESERSFWIKQYSNIKLNSSQPKFPQIFNIVEIFRSSGVKNVNDLEIHNATNIMFVCNYNPTLQEVYSQDVFHEGKEIMVNKYRTIKHFCLQKLNYSKEDIDLAC